MTYSLPALRAAAVFLSTAILCGAVAFLPGCRRAEAPAAPEGAPRAVVVTSIYPLYDWVRQVGGEAIEAHYLLPPGASPHTFEPTPGAAALGARASLLVVVGLGLDDWAGRVVPTGARRLALGEEVEALPFGCGGHDHQDHGHEHSGWDPHFWLDPARAAEALAPLTATLAELVPEAAPELEARAASYRAELQALAEELEKASGLPEDLQVVTLHAGFNYLLHRCGLPPARVITPFAGQEPSARYLQSLGRLARQEGIRVVFAEPQLSPRAAAALAREIGGRVLTLDPLGDPEDPERDSYVKLVRWNLEQLREAVPAG